MNVKKLAGERAAEYVKDGMTVGLGTGSTAYWAIVRIGERVREGLEIKAIATSGQSEQLALELGIPLTTFAETDVLDLTIDGADEVDDDGQLIKGGGGALLREKIVAAISRQLIIIVDETKRVRRLGAFPLPVEVLPFGVEATINHLKKLDADPVIRMAEGKPYVTDNGHWIADCRFGEIRNPRELQVALNQIPGVVENGLFVDMANKVIIGHGDGRVREWDVNVG